MKVINKFILSMGAIGTAMAQMPGAPAPTVQVEKVTSGFDKVERRSIGLMEPINTVLVRTAVEGYLLECAAEEGSVVQKGDVLFRIDPTRYEATVAQAQASLDEIDAQTTYAQSRYDRLSKLVDSQATSEEDKETAHAQLQELKATKLEAEAKLITAKKDLEDCTITAAITGRLGSFDSKAGNYINKGSQLASLVQIDPIYVRFPLSQSDVMGVFRGPKDISDATAIHLKTADGNEYLTTGKIAVVDNQLEGTTDSYTLWAQFDNKDSRLTPMGIGALFVRLSDKTEVSMMPLTAVHYDTDGAYCYVLDDKNTVIRRSIVIGGIQGRMQTVYSGVEKGEVIISDGAHKTRVGDTVNPAFTQTNENEQVESTLEELATYVTVATVGSMQDNTVLTSQGGRVESIRTVDITPQVQGELKEPQFTEGSRVEEGQVLFQIDTTRYQAAYNAQKARVEQLDVKIKDAQSKFERQEYLSERGASSQDDLESAKSTLQTLKAQKVAAEALLVIAQDDLNRCTIKAPMEALMGRTLVTGGNYITTSASIATLVQLSPIHVRFALSENDILSQYGNTTRMMEEAEITLVTATGDVLPTTGSIAFVDNYIHTGTDTQNCWAIFPNKSLKLQPGGVVTVKIKRKQDIKVRSIPSEALLSDNAGRYAYILEGGHAIQKRVLSGTPTEDGLVPIYYGLEEGQQVLTSNQMKLSDGSPATTEAPTETK